MSSPPGTEMFHFPGFRFRRLCVQRRMARLLPPGYPIRTPPDQSRLRLPGAFRSLLRPSSPYGAKASVVCPYTLDRRNGSLRASVHTLQFFYPKLCLCQRTIPFRPGAPSAPEWMEHEIGFVIGRAVRGLPACRLVGVTGIGPVTSSLSGTRSNQLSYTPSVFVKSFPRCLVSSSLRRNNDETNARCNHATKHGGGSRTRTRDIQLAKLALYQLSYAPSFR